MKENKVVKFVKEHKKEALVLTVASVAGIAAWAVIRDKSGNYSDIALPELNSGELIRLFRGEKGRYAGSITGMAMAVDVADLGKFGEALTTIDGIDEHEPIRLMFGTERSFN